MSTLIPTKQAIDYAIAFSKEYMDETLVTKGVFGLRHEELQRLVVESYVVFMLPREVSPHTQKAVAQAASLALKIALNGPPPG